MNVLSRIKDAKTLVIIIGVLGLGLQFNFLIKEKQTLEHIEETSQKLSMRESFDPDDTDVFFNPEEHGKYAELCNECFIVGKKLEQQISDHQGRIEKIDFDAIYGVDHLISTTKRNTDLALLRNASDSTLKLKNELDPLFQKAQNEWEKLAHKHLPYLLAKKFLSDQLKFSRQEQELIHRYIDLSIRKLDLSIKLISSMNECEGGFYLEDGLIVFDYDDDRESIVNLFDRLAKCEDQLQECIAEIASS